MRLHERVIYLSAEFEVTDILPDGWLIISSTSRQLGTKVLKVQARYCRKKTDTDRYSRR